MTRRLAILAAAMLSLAVTTNPVMALDPVPRSSGFSGFIQPGGGYLSIKSNTVAKVLSFDLSEKRISRLDDDPDAESGLIFTLPYRLAYTFAGTRTELFLGTEPGDLLALDTAQQLGIKQEMGAFGVWQAGLLFSDRVKVWRDPYVTGESRDETGRKEMGVQLVWDKVLGSNFELEYSLRNIDLTNEASGRSLALTAAERDRLDRNGTVHRASAGYGVKLGNRHTLTPRVVLFYEDLDGEAMANSGVDLQLAYVYERDPVTLALSAYVGEADFEKGNPIYSKTREDDRYGATATVYYTNPWGWRFLGSEAMRFFVTGAYAVVDSNIDFYDQEAVVGLVGVAFRWK